MLDERKINAIKLYVQGVDVTKVAETIGISRTTFYNWLADEEFKAEVNRLEQEFLTQAISMLKAYAPKAVSALIKLSEKAESEKTRLDATAKILDKLVSNATKVTIDDGRDTSDRVTSDLLNDELKEFENE